jgi:hypothetical protein
MNALHENLSSKTIEKGGSPMNSFMKAVKPTVEKINDLSSKMNEAVKGAQARATSRTQRSGIRIEAWVERCTWFREMVCIQSTRKVR